MFAIASHIVKLYIGEIYLEILTHEAELMDNHLLIRTREGCNKTRFTFTFRRLIRLFTLASQPSSHEFLGTHPQPAEDAGEYGENPKHGWDQGLA